MHRLTHHRWADLLLGLVCGVAVTGFLVTAFAAWYVDHLGFDAPILWDGYGVLAAALALSLGLVLRLRPRRPFFAGGLLTGASGASLLLLVTLWLIDNGIGFSG